MLVKALRILAITCIVIVSMAVVGRGMLTEADLWKSMAGLVIWLTAIQVLYDGKESGAKRAQETSELKGKITDVEV